MSGFRYYAQPQQEELSFPSYVPDNKTYVPRGATISQGGTCVVDGLVVLDNIVRETDV
jgi:hypothetical protein